MTNNQDEYTACCANSKAQNRIDPIIAAVEAMTEGDVERHLARLGKAELWAMIDALADMVMA